MKVAGSPSSDHVQSNSKTTSKRVVHNYRDHSKLTERALTFLLQNDDSSVKVKGADDSFPVRLHYLLEQMAKDDLSHIVSWQVHGRCFLVRDQERFVKEILPTWFRQSTYASFQRQLNLYGFKRLTAGRDKGAYYHELFLRGKRFLATRIERIKVKGTGSRKPSSPETEPNFYLAPFLPESEPIGESSQGVNHARAAESVVPVPSFASSSSLTNTTSPDLSFQRLLLSSALGNASLNSVAPSGGPQLLAPSNGFSLLFEAQKAQAASSLLLAQFLDEQKRKEAATLEYLTRLQETRLDSSWMMSVPSSLGPLGPLSGLHHGLHHRLMELGKAASSSDPLHLPYQLSRLSKQHDKQA